MCPICIKVTQTFISIYLFLREIAVCKIDCNTLVNRKNQFNFFPNCSTLSGKHVVQKTNEQNFSSFMLLFSINCVILQYSTFLLGREDIVST